MRIFRRSNLQMLLNADRCPCSTRVDGTRQKCVPQLIVGLTSALLLLRPGWFQWSGSGAISRPPETRSNYNNVSPLPTHGRWKLPCRWRLCPNWLVRLSELRQQYMKWSRLIVSMSRGPSVRLDLGGRLLLGCYTGKWIDLCISRPKRHKMVLQSKPCVGACIAWWLSPTDREYIRDWPKNNQVPYRKGLTFTPKTTASSSPNSRVIMYVYVH